MVPLHPKIPVFFKVRAVARVCAPSPPSSSPQSQQHYRKRSQSFLKLDDSSEFSSKSSSSNEIMSFDHDNGAPNLQSESNRVMVVVDSSLEAKGALQWALSHTVQPRDTIILLHISKSPKRGVNAIPRNQKAHEFLYSMKDACQLRRPGVEVEVAVRHGKEKAPIIVEEAELRKVSLLVLGQKRRSIMWCLQKMWRWKRSRKNRVVEYCIQNANCLTIAVRRKSRKHGGYLITTKRHKNFWLLA